MPHSTDPTPPNTHQELEQLFENTLYDLHADPSQLAHRAHHGRPRTPSQELARHLTRLTLELRPAPFARETSVEELTLLFARLSLEAPPLDDIAEEDEDEGSEGSERTMYSCGEGAMYSCGEGSECGSEGTVNEWDEWELGEEDEGGQGEEGEEAGAVGVQVAEEEVDAEANRVMDAIVFKTWTQFVPWVV